MVLLTPNRFLSTSAEMQVLLFYINLNFLLPIRCHICAWYGSDIVAKLGWFHRSFLAFIINTKGFKDIVGTMIENL